MALDQRNQRDSGSPESPCWAASGGVWYDIEDAPQDGTIIIGATYDRRHIGAIFMKYCDGDMEGGWVTERSHSPIRWNPECWTIVPPNAKLTRPVSKSVPATGDDGLGSGDLLGADHQPERRP